MAYDIRKIPELDLRPSTAIGVAIPFSWPSVFKPVYTTKEQLKYNIINFLLTNKRERIFNPNFGANLRSLVFNPITTGNLEDLRDSLISKLESYFPSIKINQLNVTNSGDSSEVNVFFSYTVVGTNLDDSVSVIIQSAQ